MTNQIKEIISELTDVLKQMDNGCCCVALAGAHAKGTADSDSDLDFYMIIENPKPYSERRDIILKIVEDESTIYMSEDFEQTVYGGSIDFRYKGIPIETTVRTLATVNQRVDECLDGKFEIIPELWTSNGYYTFIYLSELDFVKPLYDPCETINRYKRRLNQYPEKLRQSIIDCFLGRSNMWLDNFHYESAIKRKDYMFTAPIVMHTILNMIQVIYALNRMYFHGDKKLSTALSHMPYCPDLLLQNLEFLMSASSDKALLQKQRDILRSIRDELITKAYSPV